MHKLYKKIILAITIFCTIPAICHSTHGEVFWINANTNKQIFINLLEQASNNDIDFFQKGFDLFIKPESIVDTEQYNRQSFELKKRMWSLCRFMDSDNKVKAIDALKKIESYGPKFSSNNQELYRFLDNDLEGIVLNILKKFNCSAAATMQEKILLRKKIMHSFQSTRSLELPELIDLAEFVEEFKKLHKIFLEKLSH